jgi:sulfur carrier protein ThiS
MQAQVIKFGDAIRNVEIEPGKTTIADCLARVGQDPQNLNGFVVRVSGSTAEPKLDRPVLPGESILLVPRVAGGCGQ